MRLQTINWIYLNPFWHKDRMMISELDPSECRKRLKNVRTSGVSVARLWIGRGDANFYKGGAWWGSLLEMHVRVQVKPGTGNTSRLFLRFSGGLGSAIALSLVTAGCIWAFGWALVSLARGGGWVPIYGAALLSILVPVLLVLALRSEAPDDEDDLWAFIADQVGGRVG